MRKSTFTEEQIAYALREVESGRPPADVCRQLGVSEVTFSIWKKQYAHLGKHIALHRGPAPTPAGPTERWSLDVVHDALADGRRGVAVISPSLSMCLSSTLGELTATARVVFERPARCLGSYPPVIARQTGRRTRWYTRLLGLCTEPRPLWVSQPG